MTEVEVLREQTRKICDIIGITAYLDSLEEEVATWKLEAANARDQAVSLRLQRDQVESDVRGLRAENEVLRAEAALKAGPMVAAAPRCCPDCGSSGKVTFGYYEYGGPGDCPTCWGVRCSRVEGGGGA